MAIEKKGLGSNSLILERVIGEDQAEKVAFVLVMRKS